MAASLADQFAVSTNPDFQGKVRIALMRIALGIAADPASSPDFLAAASKVLTRMDWYVAQASLALASLGYDNDTVDTDLLTATQQQVAAAARLQQSNNQGT